MTSLIASFVAGLAVAAVFWRRQVKALVSRARPYKRRRKVVTNPTLIINRWSGGGKADLLGVDAAATAAGINTVVLEKGDDLVQLAHDAVSAGADAIGMAGGDGSLGMVAGVAVDRGVPFFCVPVGTRNHFALDLGLDRDDPLAALAAVRDGDEILIDYGIAGERPFLNNVSFGVYAQAVHEDDYRAQKLSTLKHTIAEVAADVDRQAPLQYVTPDGRRHERAPLLLISNNRYRYSGFPDYGRRLRLDDGRLGIAAITDLSEEDFASRPLSQLGALHEWDATSYRIESDERILAGLDGEAIDFASPLDIVIRPRVLRVLVPTGTRPGYVPTGEMVAAGILDLAETAGLATR